MDLSRRLNDVTNVAILAVLVLVGIQFARSYGRSTSFFAPGEVVRGIPQEELRGSPRTLLMQVSPACPACELALPFYRDLVQRVRGQQPALRVLAITTQSPNQCDAYLRENSINVDGILSPEAGERRLRLTPALVLVTSDGIVVGAWLGRVHGVDKQREVARIVGVEYPRLR